MSHTAPRRTHRTPSRRQEEAEPNIDRAFTDRQARLPGALSRLRTWRVEAICVAVEHPFALPALPRLPTWAWIATAGFVLTSAVALADPTPPDTHPMPVASDAQFGLEPGSVFDIVKGSESSRLAPAAAWYFREEWVAVRKPFDSHPAARTSPFLWVASPHHIEAAQFEDETTLSLPSGARVPLSLVPKLSSNRSFFDDSSRRFFEKRSVAARGSYRGETSEGSPSQRFIARTLWPLDWHLAAASRAATSQETLQGILARAFAQAPDQFRTHTVWQRESAAPSDDTPRAVLSLVLNGAQGDDDEALGGHFAVATGWLQKDGRFDQWTVNNFYSLDTVSEKGILAAMVPMDSYMTDLNSGQSWYRPSYVLVAVLKEPSAAEDFQGAMEKTFERFYAHDIAYDHARANCAGISVDTLAALGWHPPERGPTSRTKAIAGYYYSAITDQSFAAGRKTYRYLTEEQVRLYPRAAFEALGADLLSLVRGERKPTSDYEARLASSVDRLLFVEIPQIPSSRAPGSAPAGSFDEYMSRVPADRDQWKVVPVPPRPFPEALRGTPKAEPVVSDATIGIGSAFLPAALLWGASRIWRSRRRRREAA